MNQLATVSNEIQTHHQAVEASRAAHEVQAAYVMAKRFPRDQNAAYKRIMDACSRKTLAESAMYTYPRGGSRVTGPSIRLAEVVAQNWGNLGFGIRELSQEQGVSLAQAFCIDYETNVVQTKEFYVRHERHTNKGVTNLSDPRDIYELVANQGARRLRACILGIVPKDVVEDAMSRCQKTLLTGTDEPLGDRIRKMVLAFAEIAVTQEMIETRLKHGLDAISVHELIDLQKIYRSIKDGFGKREDYFLVPKTERSQSSETLTAEILGNAASEGIQGNPNGT